MIDIVPVLPDATLLSGLIVVPTLRHVFSRPIRTAWHMWRGPAFWPEVLRGHTDTKGTPADWIILRRNVRHRFPEEALDRDISRRRRRPTARRIFLTRLMPDMDEEALTDATAEAKRLAREYAKLEAAPDVTERAERLLRA